MSAKIYLTTDKAGSPTHPSGKYRAIISRGSPQRGDRKIEVLDIGLFDDPKDAKGWFDQQMIMQPWVKRN